MLSSIPKLGSLVQSSDNDASSEVVTAHEQLRRSRFPEPRREDLEVYHGGKSTGIIGKMPLARFDTKTEIVKWYYLNRWSGESHREIADILDVSLGTVQNGKDAAREEGWKATTYDTEDEEVTLWQRVTGLLN